MNSIQHPQAGAQRGAPTRSTAEVRGYVTRVRAALADLPAEDVEDLTQGMEADLVELAGEAVSIRSRLGTPERYADELRAAAGMAPRAPSATGGPLHHSLKRWRRKRDAVMGRAWVRDLRPVGWVLRGVVAVWVVATIVGANRDSVALWLLGAGGSFWIGRKTLSWTGPRRTALTVVNLVAAVVGLVAVLPNLVDRSVLETQVIEVPAPVDGLANNGEPVTGITVYDPSGHQIDRPRAFDQNGTPLVPATPEPDTYTAPLSLPPLPGNLTPAPFSSAPTSATPSVPGAGAGTPTGRRGDAPPIGTTPAPTPPSTQPSPQPSTPPSGPRPATP